MGMWYAVVLIGYSLAIVWALFNFKAEVNAIKDGWTKLRNNTNIMDSIKYALIHSPICWVVVIITGILSFTGIGIVLVPFVVIWLIFYGISHANISINTKPLIQAVTMFSLDLFFTTGGAGVVELGAVFGTGGGGLGTGFIMIIISNIMSVMFFLPEKVGHHDRTNT